MKQVLRGLLNDLSYRNTESKRIKMTHSLRLFILVMFCPTDIVDKWLSQHAGEPTELIQAEGPS
jgi:hypothetical protein